MLRHTGWQLGTRRRPTPKSVPAIIQDELAHANIAYRLLEDIGESKERLSMQAPAAEFKHPYGSDQPLDNWAELVVATGFFDRAGITLLSDCHENTSYAPAQKSAGKRSNGRDIPPSPWRRVWMRRLAKAGGEAREFVQRASQLDVSDDNRMVWFAG